MNMRSITRRVIRHHEGVGGMRLIYQLARYAPAKKMGNEDADLSGECSDSAELPDGARARRDGARASSPADGRGPAAPTCEGRLEMSIFAMNSDAIRAGAISGAR